MTQPVNKGLIDFCSRAPFPSLRAWHRTQPHIHMFNAIERTYGAREARVWLTGRVILDDEREARTRHFQPHANAYIPQDTD